MKGQKTGQPPHKRKKTQNKPGDDAVPTFATPALAPPTEGFTIEQQNATSAPPSTSGTHEAPKESNAEIPSKSTAHPIIVPTKPSPEVNNLSALPAHLAALSEKYAIATMSILTSSKIETKVKTLMAHMSRFSFADRNPKPGVVALHAKKAAANKMTSVAEIAKRQLEEEEMMWYQYSRIGSEEVDVEAKEKRRAEAREKAAEAVRKTWAGENVEKEEGEMQEEIEKEDERNGTEANFADDETAFETMADPAELLVRKKLQVAPTMTIYLSRVPVPEFREAFEYVRALQPLYISLIRCLREQTNANSNEQR